MVLVNLEFFGASFARGVPDARRNCTALATISRGHERSKSNVPVRSLRLPMSSASKAFQVSSICFRLGCQRKPLRESFRSVRCALGAASRSSASRLHPQLHQQLICFSTSSSDGKVLSRSKATNERPADVARVGASQVGGKHDSGLIYEGSLAHQVRSLKRISITTCIISILAVPALAVWGTQNVPLVGQIAVMGTALAGAGCSTLLLNLCVSPYVFRMNEVLNDANGGDSDSSNKQNRPSMQRLMGRRFRAERVNIFGFPTTSEFYIDEVEPMPKTSRPFVSFRANENYYFIQGHEMADKALLRTLLGRALKQHEK